jgi:hypothetical protein
MEVMEEVSVFFVFGTRSKNLLTNTILGQGHCVSLKWLQKAAPPSSPMGFRLPTMDFGRLAIL